MTSRLDIINSMLAVNGEAPVSSADSTDPSAIQARNTLARVDKRIQARGWWFNTETALVLQPNAQGEIVLPANTLSVDPLDATSSYVQRGARLYDRQNNTYTIGTSVTCNLVLQLDISELPETAASYIECSAVREHYENDDGDDNKAAKLKAREGEAFAYLRREDIAANDTNINNSPLGIQLKSATNMSGRRHPGVNFGG